MRLTPAESMTIRETAAKVGISVSSFMITAALEKAGGAGTHPDSRR